jgi:hypothetical protein
MCGSPAADAAGVNATVATVAIAAAAAAITLVLIMWLPLLSKLLLMINGQPMLVNRRRGKTAMGKLIESIRHGVPADWRRLPN